MADGTRSFNFPLPQHSKLRLGEIVVDLFAGGGGASEALKQAIGIDPALAYNHDEWAIGMHAANHPLTTHHREDIWHADPVKDVAGRKVGWFHFSPDCTHFSQAKGGQPRNHKIRALAWVGVKWVGQLARVGLAPRILSMENVWQMLSWCPLVAKRDKATGRVIKMDGTVAAVGERVPVQMQQLVPDKKRLGHTWNRFIAVLRALGYVVEWSKIDASDYGAGTQRQRLFMLARRDGEPIVWPAATHGPRTDQMPKVVAADSIDFSDIGRSIFDRPRPLADATLKRIAGGLVKHVLQAKEPFFLTEFANAGNGGRTWSGREPLRTQCARVKGGHFALVAPTLVKFKGSSIGHPVTDPMPVITAGGACKRPAGAAHSLAVMAAHLESLGVANDDCIMSPEHEAGALRVAAFLVKYYGTALSVAIDEPLDTITTRDRMALVTVALDGERYVIVDITLRMLRPYELFKAQGFPVGYIIDRTADGRVITTSTAVRMVGNSVSPPPLRALAVANLDSAEVRMRLAA